MQEGGTFLFLGPDDPNYLKTVSLAAKIIRFFIALSQKPNTEAKKKKVTYKLTLLFKPRILS